MTDNSVANERITIQHVGLEPSDDGAETFVDGRLVSEVAGRVPDADVIVVAQPPGIDGAARLPLVHARVGSTLVEGILPPRGLQPRELDVWDADQRATGLVTCHTDAWGDARFLVRIVGAELRIDEVVEPVDESEIDIAVKVGIADFLEWIHLEQSLGPAMWFSHQIFEIDLFISSLFDGVVAERPAAPLAGPAAMRRAVDLVCAAVACIAGQSDGVEAPAA